MITISTNGMDVEKLLQSTKEELFPPGDLPGQESTSSEDNPGRAGQFPVSYQLNQAQLKSSRLEARICQGKVLSKAFFEEIDLMLKHDVWAKAVDKMDVYFADVFSYPVLFIAQYRIFFPQPVKKFLLRH